MKINIHFPPKTRVCFYSDDYNMPLTGVVDSVEVEIDNNLHVDSTYIILADKIIKNTRIHHIKNTEQINYENS